MSLPPYPRRVARVEMPVVMRWPDLPVGASRQVAIDASDWLSQVDDDPIATLTATVTPDGAGLTLSDEGADDALLGCTLAATTAAVGIDFAVVLTATTVAGRIEPFGARVLVTDPVSS
jgi:hypothetical protein